MNREERMRFLDEELKGLWPQWEPTEAEIALWMGVLSGYAYSVARTALQQCVCEQAGNYRRPKPAPFLAKARVLSARTYGSGRPHQPDVQTTVFVECRQPPSRNPNLAGARKGVFTLRQDDPDHVRDCAESMRKRIERLYGGHWITVHTRPEPPVADGFRGRRAKGKACATILAGPDSPGRRWLRAHPTCKAEPEALFPKGP